MGTVVNVPGVHTTETAGGAVTAALANAAVVPSVVVHAAVVHSIEATSAMVAAIAAVPVVVEVHPQEQEGEELAGALHVGRLGHIL